MTTIDVVICTYNRASDLDACLRTLARQTTEGQWRVTVVDNNSTDDTTEVVATHSAAADLPGLRQISEPQPGLTAARQRGVRESTADWVAFVDDDCHLHPKWLAKALRVLSDYPNIGALGGRVLPDWGRDAPSWLAGNGWLFAHQDPGDVPCEVESLVGAGLVLNRGAMTSIGWTAAPLLSDRIGRGFVSGGDVEISARLKAGGYALRYEPAMVLDHRIARDRQRVGRLVELSRGLGQGAVLASLLAANDLAAWSAAEQLEVGELRRRHFSALTHVVTGRYGLNDWRIHNAFLAGRRRQLAVIAADPAAFEDLTGACTPSRVVRAPPAG